MLVTVEVLVDPAGKVAEAKVRKAPAEIVDAVLAAVKQWEYSPHLVDGKGVWIRLVSSVQIRPMDGAPGAGDAALGVPAPAAPAPAAPAAAAPAGTGTNAKATATVKKTSPPRRQKKGS
jgi:TonB family protein